MQAGAAIVGISVDSPTVNRAFADALGISFPLLSDAGGRVGTLYGLYNPSGQYDARANIVIDRFGIIRHIERGSRAIDPSSSLRACQVLPRAP